MHTLLLACRQERDTMYGIEWGNTLPGDTSMQSCGVNFTGMGISMPTNSVYATLNVLYIYRGRL